MKIYLDVFFLVNAGINLVIFMLESFFQKRHLRLARLLAVSVLGGLLAVLFLVSGIHRYRLLSVLLYGVGCAVLVRLAFGKTTVHTWFRNLILYYIASFLLSGFLQYLQGVFRQQGKLSLLLPGVGMVLYLAQRMIPFLGKYVNRSTAYIPVRLWYGGRKIQGNAFLDTGNHLTEPFTGQPVIIGSQDFVSPLFERKAPLFRYIPFHAIGTECGTLKAFQAERLELRTEGRTWVQTEKPWVAIYEKAVSADGEYEMILPSELVR